MSKSGTASVFAMAALAITPFGRGCKLPPPGLDGGEAGDAASAQHDASTKDDSGEASSTIDAQTQSDSEPVLDSGISASDAIADATEIADATAADEGGGGDAGEGEAAPDAGPGLIVASSPTSLSFFATCAGAVPPPQTFTITNVGGTPITWSSFGVTAPFSLDIGGSTLAPGGTVTVTVSSQAVGPQAFVPNSLDVQGHVSIFASNGGFNVFLDEKIGGCLFEAGPTNIGFGRVTLGQSASVILQTPRLTCSQNRGQVELGASPPFSATNLGGRYNLTFTPQDTTPQTQTLEFIAVTSGPFCNGTGTGIDSFTATGVGVPAEVDASSE